MKTSTIIFVLLITSTLFLESEGRKRRCFKEEKCNGKKIWNWHKCKCVCPKETKCFPADAIFDPNTCNWCMPCPGNEKLDFNTCKCGGCPAPAVIPENKKWDDKNCALVCKDPMPTNIDKLHQWNDKTCAVECINPKPETIESVYQWNNLTCAVECINPKPASIDSVYQWNNLTCAVECINPKPASIDSVHQWNNQTCKVECITVTSCPGKQQFMEDKCECRCNPGMPASFDNSSQYWDDLQCIGLCNWDPYPCAYTGQTWNNQTCNCTCPSEVAAAVAPTCQDPQFFSPKQGCQCVDKCTIQPPPEGCEIKMGWCPETCQCECKEETIPKYCGPLKHWNNLTCTCECDHELDCSFNSNYGFNWDTCQCGCNDPDPGDCADQNSLWSWDNVKCKCDCADESARITICPSSDPTLKKSWNGNTCECQCKKSLVKSCDPTLFYPYNYETCACDCINEPTPCESGWAWDRNVCSCTKCDHCVNPNDP